VLPAPAHRGAGANGIDQVPACIAVSDVALDEVSSEG